MSIAWSPAALGAAMAAFMLWMLHDSIMSSAQIGVAALLAFIAAHLAIGLGAIGLAFLFPAVRKAAGRHRPNIHHMTSMLIGGLICATLIHMVFHTTGGAA